MTARQHSIKLNTIDEISSIDEIVKIVTVLLEGLSMNEINRTASDFIEAKFTINNLGIQQYGFFIIIEQINKSNQHYNEFKERLNKVTNSNVYSNIFIVSSKYISKGIESKIKQDFKNILFDFWDRDELVNRIDALYPEYWRHADQDLIAYEKVYCDELQDEWSFGRIKQLKSSYEKLYSIFIEPRMSLKVRDNESPNHALVTVNVEKIKESFVPIIVEGNSGSGKTRLLRELGHSFIKDNSNKKGKKYLPVFLNATRLIESKDDSGNISLGIALFNKLTTSFPLYTIEEIVEKYELVILLDTIDEFNEGDKVNILNESSGLIKNGAKFLMGTHSNLPSEIKGMDSIGKYDEVVIDKFNNKQVKQFINKYFSSSSHADDLIQSIQENKILERLPITPLNLSLISILYEENNFEIPATITDIYDNFNNLLLGRSTIDSRIKFFDINIRERILSKYALELLERENDKAMSKEEFTEFFKKFFSPISGTVKVELLPVLLDHIIQNTGILILEEDKYVRFRHESYLEYYASREIFYYRRDDYENKLVENFLDISWQYTAIFYAGRSKDMSSFMNKIIDRASHATTIAEAWKGVSGLGYISQALYLTDDDVRKKAVYASLDLTIMLLDGMKKMGADEVAFFKKLTLPLVTIISTMWFMDSFNSITVRAPLAAAFEELFIKFTKDISLNVDLKNNIAFKLFTLALTVSNKRLNDSSKMERLLYDTSLLDDPIYKNLLGFGVELAGNKDLDKLKDSILKSKYSKNDTRTMYIPNKVTDIFSKTPAGFLRLTEYDRIRPIKKVRLYTEGKTDAQIIEHAYHILTKQVPYWNIRQVGGEMNSGARALANFLISVDNIIDSDDEIVIGIFDNDDKGRQEFGGLNSALFQPWKESKRVKKHIAANVYAIKLPVPPEKEYYLIDDQRYNTFAIEHYFSDDYLVEAGVVENSPIPMVYKIKDSKKTEFAKKIVKEQDRSLFHSFVYLFKQIDEIAAQIEVEYE
ncbi:NACHT domain-containing protein [Hymenobacter swuensis]|uniref:NACHT domain-containing protein n=1 Tax=Hymenobacter swuensis DY53 TaxID=1227739 RepID=W8F5Q0_9BACT|nr:NACHT domain-containing protein [Hymenobacter swuensis]AHJ99362.1 hypothetical protein Hsw_3767 [Hymenobacter swuensis DY53]